MSSRKTAAPTIIPMMAPVDNPVESLPVPPSSELGSSLSPEPPSSSGGGGGASAGSPGRTSTGPDRMKAARRSAPDFARHKRDVADFHS